VKRWVCPLCGGDEWLYKVENFVLLRICKQCGFEVKEMADEVLKESQNLHLSSGAYDNAKVRGGR
jgi:Zn ribbon nucleic-acid-binding protein